jgi:hypothetical protein
MGAITGELRVKLGQLNLFPGSLSEYCSFKNGHYEIMDVEGQKKYVYFDPRVLEKGIIGELNRPFHVETFVAVWTKLIESGCEGLVRYDIYQCCGMPVRKKSETSS